MWSAGPQEPQKNLTITPNAKNTVYSVTNGGSPTFLVATDDPGAVLPNGNILLSLAPLGPLKPNGGYSFPNAAYIYEYDPVAQTFTEVTPGLGAINAYELNMVVMPSGQVLLANEQGGFQVYTEDTTTGPKDAWRPTISSIHDNMDGTFTLHGTQINGLDEGSEYGDDLETASNYPIVQLTKTNGDVVYARTFNWSSTGVATGGTSESTQFTLPSGTSLDDFTQVRVIANGIASLPANLLNTNSLAENFVIRVDPIDSSIVQVLIDGSGTVVATYANNSANGIQIVGDGNNNRVIIDETYGVVNLPVSFDGGGSTGPRRPDAGCGFQWR